MRIKYKWLVFPKIDFTGKCPRVELFHEKESKETVEHLKELGFNPFVIITTI